MVQLVFSSWLLTWIPQDKQGKKLDAKKEIYLFQGHDFLPNPTWSSDQQGIQIQVLIQAG